MAKGSKGQRKEYATQTDNDHPAVAALLLPLPAAPGCCLFVICSRSSQTEVIIRVDVSVWGTPYSHDFCFRTSDAYPHDTMIQGEIAGEGYRILET